MPVHPNSLENLKKGKQFSKTHKPANTGRRRNYLNEFRSEDGQKMSLNDMQTYLENILADHSFADIEKILVKGQKTLPVFIAAYLKATIADLKKGKTDTVDKMIDRIHGKPTQTNIVEVADIPDTAKDRLDKIFSEVRKEVGKTKGRKNSGRKGTEKKEEE